MKEIVAMTMTDLCEMSGPSPKLFSAHSKFPYFPSRAFENPFSGERADDHSGFFRLYRVSWGSGFPLPALCQGAFTEGDESMEIEPLPLVNDVEDPR